MASFRGGNRRGMGGGTRAFGAFLGIGTNEERVVIKGENFDLMKGVAEDLEYYIENLESIRSANVSVANNRPEVHMYFNQLLLTEYNLTLNNCYSWNWGPFQGSLHLVSTSTRGLKNMRSSSKKSLRKGRKKKLMKKP